MISRSFVLAILLFVALCSAASNTTTAASTAATSAVTTAVTSAVTSATSTTKSATTAATATTTAKATTTAASTAAATTTAKATTTAATATTTAKATTTAAATTASATTTAKATTTAATATATTTNKATTTATTTSKATTTGAATTGPAAGFATVTFIIQLNGTTLNSTELSQLCAQLSTLLNLTAPAVASCVIAPSRRRAAMAVFNVQVTIANVPASSILASNATTATALINSIIRGNNTLTAFLRSKNITAIQVSGLTIQKTAATVGSPTTAAATGPNSGNVVSSNFAALLIASLTAMIAAFN